MTKEASPIDVRKVADLLWEAEQSGVACQPVRDLNSSISKKIWQPANAQSVARSD